MEIMDLDYFYDEYLNINFDDILNYWSRYVGLWSSPEVEPAEAENTRKQNRVQYQLKLKTH